MPVNTNLSASANLSVPLTQNYASGGSVSNSSNGSWSRNQSSSITNAEAARAFSAQQAALAYERQKELMKMEQDYNTEQAKISRDWEESMANTIYTRSVKNMREAGINPILAANMGLSGASVGSGATASISGASAPIAQSFMDTSSASSGASESWGESNGSSWSQSEGGIVTALSALAEMFGQMAETVNSGSTVNIVLDGLKDLGIVGKDETATDVAKDVAKGAIGGIIPGLGNLFGALKSASKITEKAKEKAKEGK